MLSRWKKAVVHLECAADSDDAIKRREELIRILHSAGDVTSAPGWESALGRDVRSRGSALFIQHDGKHYLLTARHVVYNKIEAERRVAAERLRAEGFSPTARAQIIDDAEERAQWETVFPFIFRVPTFDEVSAKPGAHPTFIKLVGVPGDAHIFSSPELDLAVISLHNNKRFVEELLRVGYEPVSRSDMAMGPSAEGVEVFTVGYPGSTSVLIPERDDVPEGADTWRSRAISLPSFSFGRVSMLHTEIPMFWADLAIAPGSSGGPVVEGDRLVGIVIQQAHVPVKGQSYEGELSTGIPFSQGIKAEYALPLIDRLHAHVLAVWS